MVPPTRTGARSSTENRGWAEVVTSIWMVRLRRRVHRVWTRSLRRLAAPHTEHNIDGEPPCHPNRTAASSWERQPEWPRSPSFHDTHSVGPDTFRPAIKLPLPTLGPALRD